MFFSMKNPSAFVAAFVCLHRAKGLSRHVFFRFDGQFSRPTDHGRGVCMSFSFRLREKHPLPAFKYVSPFFSYEA